MKDFYKILGVMENASEEEMRERWVELTKRYHPDRGEDLSSDEGIREINEAYQVLKHSSTRVEYDLKRTYGQKKRKSYSKRVGIPAGILVIAILICIIYVINSQNGTNGTDQTSPKSPITHSPNELRTDRPDDSVEQKPLAASTHPRIVASTQSDPPRRDTMVAEGPRDDMPQTSKGPTSRTVQADSLNEIDLTTQRIDDVKAPITKLPNDQMTSSPINSTNPTNPKLELAEFKPPSALGTEDEVRRFFNDYVERYNRMDLDGFFSLFSSGAVQNKKDGLEKIRKIYTDFFNQGREVRYHMQEMRIEIYQNVITIKARYEIEQIVEKSGERKVWRGPIQWVLVKEDGTLKILSIDYKHEKIPKGKSEESNETS